LLLLPIPFWGPLFGARNRYKEPAARAASFTSVKYYNTGGGEFIFFTFVIQF